VLVKSTLALPLDRRPQGKAKGEARPVVRVVRRSSRLLDRDNLYGGGHKALLDQLRYSGLIPDDSEASIDYEITQEKVAPRDAETVITIEYPD
jgi:hypothetical protein